MPLSKTEGLVMRIPKHYGRRIMLVGFAWTLLAMMALVPARALAATPTVTYRTHVQTYGWQSPQSNGALAGTTGESKRLESIRIKVTGTDAESGITYKVHRQTYGWTGWKSNNAAAGTTGQSKRLEAINIKLTGKLAEEYDVRYRVPVQTYGWQGWRYNGALAGTTGQSKRLEAIQIELVKKPSTTSPTDPTPGDTSVQQVASPYDVYIMGASKATQAAIIKHFNSVSPSYPSSVYTSKGASTITKFVQLMFEAAESEGVCADVVYAQAMLETNYLQFGGDVRANQCNFAGLGATGGGVRGNVFPNVKTGLLAQVQHLKAYASTKPLNNACVDVRFDYVECGIAPTVGDLSLRWATSSTYGKSITSILNEVYALC